MMRSLRPRETANLTGSIQQKLNMYALAAGSAAVSILAVEQPAQARIVYTHVHKAIGQGLTLDLNNDGIGEFKIEYASTSGAAPGRRPLGITIFLAAASLGSNRVWGGTNPELQAAALPAGFGIRPNTTNFQRGGTIGRSIAPGKSLTYRFGVSSYYLRGGPWSKSASAHLGLKFFVKGKIHYGWARLSHSANSTKSLGKWFLEDYAYETIPKKPIITGKRKGPNEIDTGKEQPKPASLVAPSINPATLGVLAVGWPGLSIWRRAAGPKSQAK